MEEKAVTWANDERTKVNLKSAIMGTLLELWKIRWIHSFKPALRFSSFKFKISALPGLSGLKILTNQIRA
jgi:hypothetical protein